MNHCTFCSLNSNDYWFATEQATYIMEPKTLIEQSLGVLDKYTKCWKRLVQSSKQGLTSCIPISTPFTIESLLSAAQFLSYKWKVYLNENKNVCSIRILVPYHCCYTLRFRFHQIAEPILAIFILIGHW